MQVVNNIIDKINVLKKIKELENSNFIFSISGGGLGEKILSVFSAIKKRIVITSGMLETLEYVNGLTELGVRARELTPIINAPIYSPFKNETFYYRFIKTIYDFLVGNLDVIVLPAENLICKYPKKINLDNIIKLTKNSEYNFIDITKKLIENGYKKCEKIEKIGDFSIKGDILDVFLPNFENPIRLDFFGDELEKIYTFDIFDMQKIEDLSDVEIFPLKLYFLNLQERQDLISNLKNSLRLSTASGDAIIKSNTIVNEIIEGLENNLISDDAQFLSFLF